MDYFFEPNDYFERNDVDNIWNNDLKSYCLELGCGDGRFICKLAEKNTKWNFLGIERLLGRYRKSAKFAKSNGLDSKRLKFLRLESLYALEYFLPLNIFNAVFLLFPDPWPKRRHKNNRLVENNFSQLVSNILDKDGMFFFKSDDNNYFSKCKDELVRSNLFEIISWADYNGSLKLDNLKTTFELKWLKEGKRVFDLVALKK